jgi:protein phosphatase-4 regulatory subunit 3
VNLSNRRLLFPVVDYNTAVNLALILDISSFCVEHHTYHIKNYVISKDLLRRILILMKSDHKFLVLGKLKINNINKDSLV